MTNEQRLAALEALNILCERLDGYQTAKDIIREALQAPQPEVVTVDVATRLNRWLEGCCDIQYRTEVDVRILIHQATQVRRTKDDTNLVKAVEKAIYDMLCHGVCKRAPLEQALKQYQESVKPISTAPMGEG